MNKTIIFSSIITIGVVGALFMYYGFRPSPFALMNLDRNTIVDTQRDLQYTTKTTEPPVNAKKVQYKNANIGVSFSYPSNLTLEKNSTLTDSNIVNFGTQSLKEKGSDATIVTIYDRPVAVGSLGTRTILHKERNVNGKIVKMYYETSPSSETPITIGIGWSSEINTAYMFFTPQQLPKDLESFPDDVFDGLELHSEYM